MKRLVSIVAVGTFAFHPIPSLSAQESQPSLALLIAKTAAKVIPFGTAEGGSGRVVLRLYKSTETGWRELSSTRVVPEEDGSFRVKFERPRRGECRVVALYGRDVREEEEFHCYIPNFAQGTAELTSRTDPLSPITIDALIADSDRKREHGLMFRARMRSDLGMAFLWDGTHSGGFWMKNTLIPLSIAFFDSNGVIVHITDMEPCDDEPCPSYGPDQSVQYSGALEVNRGAFDEWGISEGDRIEISG